MPEKTKDRPICRRPKERDHQSEERGRDRRQRRQSTCSGPISTGMTPKGASPASTAHEKQTSAVMEAVKAMHTELQFVCISRGL